MDPLIMKLEKMAKFLLSRLRTNRIYSPRDSLSVQLQDENGLVLRSFHSLAEAAKYFGVDPKTAKY